jgi:hypothetical protein
MAPQGATPAGNGGVVPLRIERGAEASATDGALGTVEQVVMNPQTRELQAIVVHPLDAGESGLELVIGIAHVVCAGENQVHLDFSTAQMAADPALAQPYNPEAYVPVLPEAGMRREEAARIAQRADQPVVAGLEPNAIEVMAPADQIRPQPAAPVQSQAPPERLTADWRVPGNIASVAPRPLEPRMGGETQQETQQRMETRAMRNASKSTGKTASDRSPETPQQTAYNRDGTAYAGGATTTTTPANALPAWVTPVAIGAGVAVAVAGTTVGALAWRRASQPTGLNWWRWQLKQMARDPQKTSRQLARSLQRSARSTVKQVTPELATVATLAGDQADSWRSMLGGQLDAWRDSVGGPAMKNAKQISKRVSKNLPKGAHGWAAALAAMAVLADKQLDGWRYMLGHQLDDWRDTVGDALEVNSKSLSRTLSRSAKQISRAPRRVATRAAVRARWFRRGAFFGVLGGAVLGLLFAPVPGSRVRQQVWGFLQQLGGQVQTTMANAQANLQQGATGTTTTTTGTTGMGKTSKTTRPLTESGTLR